MRAADVCSCCSQLVMVAIGMVTVMANAHTVTITIITIINYEWQLLMSAAPHHYCVEHCIIFAAHAVQSSILHTCY